MSLQSEILQIGKNAANAALQLARLSEPKKVALLQAMADALVSHSPQILSANNQDVTAAKAAGISTALLDRLTLTDKRLQEMAQSLRDVAALKSPIGQIIDERTRPNGLVIKKVRVPIGVIGMVYEARPNVTSEVVALCVMSSNAVILRGGSESFLSNQAITNALHDAWQKADGPPFAFQLIQNTDRQSVKELVKLKNLIDLVILRGGEGLIQAATQSAEVPVIIHGKGICHIYVDKTADIQMALKIADNAKVQRPSVCNAMETLLVHQDISKQFLPDLGKLLTARDVELRGCKKTRAILPNIKTATEEDWHTEYLDLILSIRVVDDLDQAITHINHYGSHHSDAILTSDSANAEQFLTDVNSAVVYQNASTRFTDGGQFGMGAEIGISTNKLHARGPMGLEELTTYKWVVHGAGQVR